MLNSFLLVLSIALGTAHANVCTLNLDKLRFTSSVTRAIPKLRLDVSTLSQNLRNNPRVALSESEQNYVILRTGTETFVRVVFNVDGSTVSTVQAATLEEREAYTRTAVMKESKFHFAISDAAEQIAAAQNITPQDIVAAMNIIQQPFVSTPEDVDVMISLTNAKAKPALGFTAKHSETEPFLLTQVGPADKAFQKRYAEQAEFEQKHNTGDFDGVMQEGFFKNREIHIPLAVQRKLAKQNGYKLNDILTALANATHRTVEDENDRRDGKTGADQRRWFGTQLTKDQYVRVVVAVNKQGLYTVVTMFPSTFELHRYYLRQAT